VKIKPSLVALERSHLKAALSLATITAAIWLISDIVDGGFTAGDLYLVLAYFVVLAGALTWANWYEDNRLEQELRASRRRPRPTAQPKSRPPASE
jgi:hypothetical protein